MSTLKRINSNHIVIPPSSKKSTYYHISQSSPSDAQQIDHVLNNAVQNIQSLQQSLTFVLQLNKQLKTQNQQLQQLIKNNQQFYQQQILTKDKEMQKYKLDHQNLKSLLQQTKIGIQTCNQEIQSKQQEITKLRNIIKQQKITINLMQQQQLEKGVNSSVLNQSSLFLTQQYQNLLAKNQILQKQIQNITFQFKRMEQNYNKLQQKSKKYQQDGQNIRQWMAKTIGIQRVTLGCQNLIMKQISNRIKNTVPAFESQEQSYHSNTQRINY